VKSSQSLLLVWIVKTGSLIAFTGMIGRVLRLSFSIEEVVSLLNPFFGNHSGVRVSWDRPEKADDF
jgi:hypothetical protein